MTLARSLLGCSEGIPHLEVCPWNNGVRVAFTVPVRKRVKQVWTLWGCVLGQLRLALAARHLLGKPRGRPNPVQAPAGARIRSVFASESTGRSRLALLGRRSAGGGFSEAADGAYATKVIPFTMVLWATQQRQRHPAHFKHSCVLGNADIRDNSLMRSSLGTSHGRITATVNATCSPNGTCRPGLHS